MSNTDNAYFFGFIGVASALVFASTTSLTSDLGAAYGSAKAGVGICSMGVLKPELIMKSVVPVVMAGILGIYGMIVAVIIVQKSKCTKSCSHHDGVWVLPRVCTSCVRTVLWVQLAGKTKELCRLRDCRLGLWAMRESGPTRSRIRFLLG